MLNNYHQKVNLFAFPFAGAFEFSYNQIKDHFGDDVEFRTLELAGRGKRHSESLMKDSASIANDLYNRIKDNLHQPYMFYGHSLGALLGYLVLKRIRDNQQPMPMQVFFTGAKSPSKRLETTSRYTLGKEEFVKEIRKLGGSSDEVLENPELMDYLEPILRADLEVLETYTYQKDNPINFPLFVAAGTDDEITGEDLIAWTDLTSGSFEMKQYRGSHFFIYDTEECVIQDIGEKIKELING